MHEFALVLIFLDRLSRRCRIAPTCSGRAMFLSVCSPKSSKAISSLPAASLCTRAETQIPPGSAKPSRRAATFTPLPKMSPSSTTTSPTLMPIRNSIRLSVSVVALRPAMPACSSVAQRSASTTLLNSTSRPSPPSPVVLTSRPLCLEIVGSISSARIALRPWRVPPLSAPISREYPRRLRRGSRRDDGSGSRRLAGR
jgi:hypothetical protein